MRMERIVVMSVFAALAVIMFALYALVLIPNYQDCRASGHSVMYCAMTHFVR